MNDNRIASLLPRYGAIVHLEREGYVLVSFTWVMDAMEFARRLCAPGEYWEVVDHRTGNVVATSENQGRSSSG